MRLISKQELLELLTGGKELVEEDGEALQQLELTPDCYNVALTDDDRVIKFFRIKSLLSISLFYPYSVKFIRNTRRLHRLDIVAPVIEDFFFCPAIMRWGVVYPLLEGETLASRLGSLQEKDGLFGPLAAFIAELHEKGIYFRALHLRNIIATVDNRLGLIDVTDISFQRKPLTLSQRQRNFGHFLKREFQREALEIYGLERFVTQYLDATSLADAEKEKLLGLVT